MVPMALYPVEEVVVVSAAAVVLVLVLVHPRQVLDPTWISDPAVYRAVSPR